MLFKHIIYAIGDGIATITLHRPEAFNALCNDLNKELEQALELAAHNPDVRVLIITGGPTVFAAGADIKEMLASSPLEARETSHFGHSINDRIEELPVPVIAAICGPALGGGCELALSCDFRVMGENAKLGLPEVGLGILPGAGGTQRLVRLIGSAKAREMVLLGRQIKGAEAQNLGLATQVVPDEEVMGTALSMAGVLMEKPASALMLAKQAMVCGENHGFAAGKVFENILFGMAFSSRDQMEGMTAFVERRPPNYMHIRS